MGHAKFVLAVTIPDKCLCLQCIQEGGLPGRQSECSSRGQHPVITAVGPFHRASDRAGSQVRAQQASIEATQHATIIIGPVAKISQ